jgi:hypothetical protein
MSYIKNFLPEEEDDPGPNEEEEWVEKELPKKKYLCIGTDNIEAHWLQRWYKVPYIECVFYHDTNVFNIDKLYDNLIRLTVRPDGDYEQYLKILKTERLLNGV